MGCTSSPLKSSEETAKLFPDGLYQQAIEIHFVLDKVEKSFSFSGVLKKNKDQYVIYSYNGFGLNLFKLQDNGTAPVVFETSIAEIEKNKDFFLKIYPSIKKILKLDKKDFQSQLPELGRLINGQILLHFDKDSEIPRRIEIQGENKYHVVIKNLQFKSETDHR